MKWKQLNPTTAQSTDGHKVFKAKRVNGYDYHLTSPNGYVLGSFDSFSRCQEVAEIDHSEAIDWLNAYVSGKPAVQTEEEAKQEMLADINLDRLEVK